MEHPLVALASRLTRELHDAGDVSVLGLAGAEVDLLIETELSLISRLRAMLAQVLEQAAVVDRPAELAAPSMAAWLRGRFGLTPSSSSRLIRDVADLRAAPVAAEAARFGAIPVAAAVEIGHAVAALPAEVGPEVRTDGAAVLLGFAVGADGPQLDAHELRLAGRHLHEILDPDAADVLLAQRLEREEREVDRRRFLSITDDDSGGVRLRGLLTAEAGAILRAVLGPLAAPHPTRPAPTRNDPSAHDPHRPVPTGPPTLEPDEPATPPPREPGTVQPADPGTVLPVEPGTVQPVEPGTTLPVGQASTLPSESATPLPADPGTSLPAQPATSLPAEPGPPVSAESDPLPDERSFGQRTADALVEACERLLAQGDLPATGGDRPQLLLTVDHQQLTAGIGAGTLPDGTQLAPATIRRIACDAGLIPAVLGGASQPLDLGRTTRTATPTQRKALILRDGGCSFPGCDRPASWSQAHHIKEWQHLGPTDLTNLLLACGFHHRLIHHDHWEIRPATDGSRPQFIPPAWLDPHRRPRRNLQHHLRNLYRGSP